ncbi:MAG: trigger factor, partial [Herbinix sp.]|nr:trigger factor [Herbinix sp.]
MKKRVLILIVGICMIMLAGGCSKKNDLNDNSEDKDQNTATETEGTDTTDTADTADTTDPADTTDTTGTTTTDKIEVVKEDFVVGDFIKLGQYKGIEVTVTKLEVTDANVDTAIQEDLTAHTTNEEITDRTDVQNGDIANIDYEGLKDGVAFEGGTATATDLTIGSNQFIPGFEEKLIGTKVGDKVEIELTFPEDYSNSPELAGQDVVFKVTVNAIKKEVVPELNLEYVQANTDYDTVDAYREGI